MTRDEAERRAAELNRSPADGEPRRWIAHHRVGERWEVVAIGAPGMTLPETDGPRHAQRGPEREPPADPRPSIQRAIPPFGPS